jgi:hypothetical protein
MRALSLIIVGAALCAAQSPLSVLKTVGAITGDYPLNRLQQAIDDGRNYQDNVACVPYIIEIQAGQTITGNFSLGFKKCTQNLEIRSSSVGQIVGRVQPAAQAPLLATLQSPGGGSTLVTVPKSNAAYYAIRGLKITQVPQGAFAYALVSVGDINTEVTPAQAPSNIEFDRVWIAGNPNEEGPDQAIIVAGSNILVHDSWIEQAHSTYFDSQGILILNASNVVIENNYIDGAAENIFMGYQTVNIDIHGNHIYKPPALKWSNGTAAPSGACFSDALTGERYTQFRAPYPASTNITGVANNGNGLIRLTVPSHGFSTGDMVQLGNGLYGVGGGALGSWNISVIDANTFDLQGSAFGGTWNPGTGTVQKVTQLYVCSEGSWKTTSTLFGSNWVVKNNWESKGTTHNLTYGNVFENAWTAAQEETAVINTVDPPYTSTDVQFYANQALNATDGFIIAGLNIVAPYGPADINIHDNLWPSLGIFTPNGAPGNMSPFKPSGSGVVGFPITNLTYRHNTALVRRDDQRSGQSFPFVTNGPGYLAGETVYSDNLISNAYGGVTTLNNDGPIPLPGWCAFAAANAGTYVFGHNIYSTIDQPGFVSMGFSLNFAAAPNCSTYWSYANSDSWLSSNGSYNTVFASTAGSYNTWNYHCLASYTKCHNAGTDGSDIGANIDLINWATATAVSGAENQFFHFTLKPPILSHAGAMLNHTAPSTAACTTVVSSNPDYSSPVSSVTDGGGDPSRSMTLTGLAPNTLLYQKVTCGNSKYVLEQRFETAP